MNATAQRYECKPAPRRPEAIRPELYDAKMKMEWCWRSLENVKRDACEEAGICYHCEGNGYIVHHYHDGDSVHDTCTRCSGNGGGNAAYYAIVGQFEMPPDDLAIGERYTRLCDENWLSENFESGCNYQSWKGYRVRVARGRKVPIGTEGVVFWVGASQYGMRVGLRVEGEEKPVWVDMKNIDMIWAD